MGFLLLKNCNKVQEKRKTCFDGLAFCLLCVGLPEPIELNQLNCVRLSSDQMDLVRLSSICSIEFDLFGNRTH